MAIHLMDSVTGVVVHQGLEHRVSRVMQQMLGCITSISEGHGSQQVCHDGGDTDENVVARTSGSVW